MAVDVFECEDRRYKGLVTSGQQVVFARPCDFRDRVAGGLALEPDIRTLLHLDPPVRGYVVDTGRN